MNITALPLHNFHFLNGVLLIGIESKFSKRPVLNLPYWLVFNPISIKKKQLLTYTGSRNATSFNLYIKAFGENCCFSEETHNLL